MRIAVVAGSLCALAGIARAQNVDRRYAEEPTSGVALPAAPLAGEFDGRVVAMNPGGLPLVRGAEVALALGLEDPDVATSAGQGFGSYLAFAGGGGLFPRFGMGIGLEWLRPSRSNLAPDPGSPFRLTLGFAAALGKNTGLGFSWHRFHDDGPLSGVDTFDLGLATRVGNHVAIGAVLRDLATSPIANTPVQRRYELETVIRPAGTDALEVAVGGRLGETRLDLDGWTRLSAKIARGFYAHAMFESRELHALVDSPTGRSDVGGRDYRGTLGLELSFGATGIAAYATGLRDDTRSNHPLGGTLILRTSALGPASVIGSPDHIEKVELEGTISLREMTGLVARLRAIARDPSAKAVVVSFDGISGGWATLQELRDELLALRRAGKKVFAYMVTGTGRDYFVASAADKIYLDPAGGVRLVGMAGTSIYFRGLFDQIGVLPQFEKIAEFKSAPEQFTEVGPSPAAAKMMKELYDSIWDQWLTQVAAARKLGKDELQKLIDTGPFSAGDLAVDRKLVDGIGPPDKVSQMINAEIGVTLPVTRPPAARPERWQRPGIAVIYVEGTIAEGKSRNVPVPIFGGKLAGGETLVAAITAARANPNIGAIILRIDSPGGSALASELIAREVFATRGVKPILCSMSDLAASGGYFIAAGCDQIFAEPMTITGSIGIYYGKFDISGVLKKLGVTTDTHKRGKRADAETNFRPWTDDERKALQGQLRYMYGRFVGAVAEGRAMKKDEVDAVGRGHVWTGEQAKPIKLVTRFGGLGDAIDEAKKLMKVPQDTRVALVELPVESTSLLGRLTGLGSVKAPPTLSIGDLPVFRDLLRGVPATVLINDGSPQAHLPFDIIWK
jgi:protease-4